MLEDLSSAHNYRAWLAGLAQPYLGDDALEIGSGNGDYAEEWIRSGLPRITVSEADPSRLAMLSERFAGNQRVTVRELQAPVVDTAMHTAVVALNVLEHIEDDTAALRSFAGLVRPGGNLVFIVPAFNFAMSRFDVSIGHYRRYTIRMMNDALTAAGLEPVQVRYVNPVGLVAWLVMMKALRGRPKAGLPLRVYDGAMVPLLRKAEQRFRPPFGQSVFAVARRPLEP
ncbi:class I SAM-dependent methyltransferase [Motilibacter sp. K478]|nr:class I SAM-dependent methyltransferase [Motilibacter aurantiacus]